MSKKLKDYRILLIAKPLKKSKRKLSNKKNKKNKKQTYDLLLYIVLSLYLIYI